MSIAAEVIQAAAERYRSSGRWAMGFARGKMANDPAYAAVLTRLPEHGLLLDLGCGEGHLLALARTLRPSLTLVGMDHDSARIARGQAALGSEAALTVEDVRHTALPKAQVIVCLDLLHYMPPEHQDALLQRCAAALEPGGLLLIRDGHSGAGFRSWVTEWSERLSTAIGRHKGDGVYFRPSEEIAEFLRANGLSVELLPCSSGTPFSNALWIARREE